MRLLSDISACLLLLALLFGCGPTKLYSGPTLPKDRVAIVRADGIHRLVKVDKQEVRGRAFSVIPGQHLLEFKSSSPEKLSGTDFPASRIECYADLALDPGHVYELQGEFTKTTPEVSTYKYLSWRFYDLDARLMDTTEGVEVTALVCPHACRAIGKAGLQLSFMRCDKYLAAVSGAPVAKPVTRASPSGPDLFERFKAECDRRGKGREGVCVLSLAAFVLSKSLANGGSLEFVPLHPDDLLPDSREKAIEDCNTRKDRASLTQCLADHGWTPLP